MEGFGFIPPETIEVEEKPLGEWNKMRVVAKDATVEVFVNGTLVNKGWKASATEGANIQFRNIRIKQ